MWKLANRIVQSAAPCSSRRVTRSDGMAIRPLTADIWLVHRNWSMVGDTDPDGTPCQPPEGIVAWIVRRDGWKWLIDAAHNMNIVPGVVPQEHRKPASFAADSDSPR